MNKKPLRFLSLVLAVVLLCAACPISAGAESGVAGFEPDFKNDIHSIGDGVYLISDYGLSYAYLIVGSESCLLIDSGVGFEDFRQRVEPYAEGKPITLALTHGHVDHGGASGQFDTVYVNSNDFELCEHQCSLAFRKFFVNAYRGLIKAAFKTTMPAVSDKNNVATSTLVDMEDGHVFDLGGRTVTFTLTPGHTAGSGCFFDSKTKYLFTGDMNSNFVLLIFSESQSASVYNASMKKIIELEKNASAVWIGHNCKSVDPAITQAQVDNSASIMNTPFSFLPLPYLINRTVTMPDGSTQKVFILGWLNKTK